MHSTPIITLPLSASSGLPPRVDIEVVRAAVAATDTALIHRGVRVPADIRLRWKAGFDTAAWQFLPPHVITIGDRVLKHATAATQADPSKIRSYVQSYYEHELAHACYTERDLDSVIDALVQRLDTGLAPTMVVPSSHGATEATEVVMAPWLAGAFGLVNLFEDARIEHRWRADTVRTFGWRLYEETPTAPAGNALDCFKQRIQSEGALPTVPGVDQFVADEYYTRCCDASDTWAIVDLAVQWWREAGVYDTPDACNAPGDRTNDLCVAAALLLGCSVPSGDGTCIDATQWDGDACTLTPTQYPEPAGNAPLRGSGTPVHVEASGGCANRYDPRRALPPVQLADEAVTLPAATVDRLVGQLSRAFGRTPQHGRSWSPSHRLSARAVAARRPPYRHLVAPKGRGVSVALYVDCSGSMNGVHIEEAQILVAALSRLACVGQVQGEVILVAQEGRIGCHSILPLPVPDDTTGRIMAYANAEGIEAALTATRHLVQGRDLVLVYSDGEINDTPIDKRKLHAWGIHPIGCYVGDPKQAKRLERWFPTVLVAPSAEGLVEMIVATQRRH